jgi:hypothetical protein
MALIIVGHRGAAPLLHRQPRLGAVEGPGSGQGQALDLALRVDAEDHGMGRRIDIEADDFLELVGEFGVVGERERPHPMRLQSVPRPDAAHRGRADLHRLGHRRRGPMGRLMRRGSVGQRHHPIDGLGRQRRDARGPRLVAGQPVNPLMHKAFLPAPNHGLALANGAHDGGGALAIRRQQSNPCAPDVLPRAVAIPDDRLQASPIRRRDLNGYPLAHTAQWQSRTRREITIRTLPSGIIH